MSTQAGLIPYSQSLLATTAELLAAVEECSAGVVGANAIMETFIRAPDGLIPAAIEFRKRTSEPFLPVSHIGGELRDLRYWLRWPLGRILVRRRAARIRHPLTGELALAFPLIDGDEATIVVAVLADRTFTADELAFISAVEHIRTSFRAAPRFDGTAEPMEPAIVSLGPLASTLRGVRNVRCRNEDGASHRLPA